MKKQTALLFVYLLVTITLFLPTFTNAQTPPIVINPNAPGNPYPSTYTVSGLSGKIAATPASVQIRINGFSHPSPGEVAFLLEGPTGARILLQSGVGGVGSGVSNISYAFSDLGIQMPIGGGLQNEAVYKPTFVGGFPIYPSVGAVQGPFKEYNNPGPAAGETATLASTFGGTNPNGVWKLYVLDTRKGGGVSGQLQNWSLDITTVNTPPISTGGFFVGSDFTTKGNWSDKYGTEGAWVIGDVKNLPEWAQIAITAPTYVWANSTSEARALKKISNPNDRVAAAVYTANQTELSFNLTDGRTHRITLYTLDWDRNSREESFTLINNENGEIFDTSSVGGFFAEGHYRTFQARGSFKIRLTRFNGNNAVVSGIFLDAPPSADTAVSFVGVDSVTRGNWQTAYGAQGRKIIGDRVSEISYKTLSVYGHQQHTWVNPTLETRAPKKTYESERIAAAYYASNQFGLVFDLAVPRRLALYALDWDSNSREQIFEVVDSETGAILDTRTVTDFNAGKYFVWTVKGRFTVRVKNAKTTGNAVLSAAFLDEPDKPLPVSLGTTGSFVGFDNYSKGTWKGNYGAQAYYLVTDGNKELTSGGSTPIGREEYTWASDTNDERALQKARYDDRRAATFYAPKEFAMEFTFSDNQAHRLALYSVDWENAGRQQIFELVNAETGAVMDTRTVGNFSNGIYVVWQVKGRVTVRIKKISGPNAIVSGWFVDAAGTALPPPPPPPPADQTSANFVRFDANTKGNWFSNYGGQGYSLIGDATVLPAHIQLSALNQNAYVWKASTADPRALVKPVNINDRIAATFYAPNQFELNFNLTDAQTHRLALYALDWEGNSRQQTFELVNTDTGTVLDTRTLNNFNGGVYVVWDVTGKFTVRVKKVAGPNAVLSGVFLDSVTSDETTGSFVGFNTNTQGNWMGTFGTQGSWIIAEAKNLPNYARLLISGQNVYTWVQSTADVRALTKGSLNSDRIASTFYTPNQMDLSFYFTDEQIHRLSIYNLDWDTNNSRSQTLELIDTTTGAVIDTKTISNFSNGVYTTWSVKGKVTVRVKKIAGPNAVISGVFID